MSKISDTKKNAGNICADNVEEWNQKLSKQAPQAIIEEALNQFRNRIAISFSGAEDVVLIHMAITINTYVRIFTLDTGRLHPETYQFIEKVKNGYLADIEVCFPEAYKVEALVNEKGLFSFYRDNHAECCAIRKVDPLRKKLATLKAWITGQRKDQSPSTRQEVPVVQLDKAFSTPDHDLIKFNPIANWSSAQVWQYIRANKVPYNTLHEKGFVSIGCEPCTRAVLPNQHEREGRWWWEEATQKECGLHSDNVNAK